MSRGFWLLPTKFQLTTLTRLNRSPLSIPIVYVVSVRRLVPSAVNQSLVVRRTCVEIAGAAPMPCAVLITWLVTPRSAVWWLVNCNGSVTFLPVFFVVTRTAHIYTAQTHSPKQPKHTARTVRLPSFKARMTSLGVRVCIFYIRSCKLGITAKGFLPPD
jgi:hypothetical protein